MWHVMAQLMLDDNLLARPWQVAVHSEVQLQARHLFEGLFEAIVQKPIYLVDFAPFEVPAE